MDQQTLYIVIGVVAALLVLFLLVRLLSRKPAKRQTAEPQPYVARTDRPYVTAPEPSPAPDLSSPAPVPAAEPDGAQGNTITDEMASAATDVVGQMLETKAHAELPGATGADDLQRLKGVGPKLASRLNELGFTRYDQIAGLGENEVAILDEKLGAFKGRLARDRVVEQAGYLARGDTEGFEAQFGKLGGAA